MSVDTGALVVRRSRAEIERLVVLYRSSGMRRRDFCRSYEMAISTLARHLKKHRSKLMQTDGLERSHLVAVELSTPARFVRCADVSATLIVLLPNNRRVEVGHGFDQDTLAQLLTVLEKL